MSKIVQLNPSEVCIVGGSQSLFARDYYGPSSCSVVNIETGELQMKTSMNYGRMLHSACFVGNSVLVVGGVDRKGEGVRTCERYHTQKDKWFQISDGIDEYTRTITLVPIAHRYVFAFGGRNDLYQVCLLKRRNTRAFNEVRVLDVVKIQPRWTTL